MHVSDKKHSVSKSQVKSLFGKYEKSIAKSSQRMRRSLGTPKNDSDLNELSLRKKRKFDKYADKLDSQI